MPHTKVTRASIVSLVANMALSGIKVLVGIIGNSYALIADGIESLADCISSMVVWNGLRIGSKEPDADHPYGHGKAEAIATLIAGIGLLVSGILIAIQAVNEILSFHEPPDFFTVPALMSIIALKELLFRYLRRQASNHDSAALMAEAIHHRSDALTSLCVLVGISISVFAGSVFAFADDVAALLVTILIFRNGLVIMRPSIEELMDRPVGGERCSQIRQCILETPGVYAVETLWIRRSGRRFHVEVHLEVDPEITVREGHSVAHLVKNRIMQMPGVSIEHVHTHVEPADLSPPSQDSPSRP